MIARKAQAACAALALCAASRVAAEAPSFHTPKDRPPVGVPATQMPAQLKDVGFDQRLGSPMPLDAVVRDEDGNEVRFGDLLQGKPTILSLVYYQCPMLCTMVLNGLTSCLEMVQFDAGNEFRVLTLSFDGRETPELAKKKKAAYLKRYGRPGAEEGWRFLTTDPETVRRITEAVGFRYTFDEQTGQFAHASGIVVLTPDGTISRYFYGVEYPPKDVRLGLVEAADRKIGGFVDQVLLYCFHYDPTTGKYGAAVLAILRLASVAMLVALAGFFWAMRRRHRRTLATVKG